MYTSTELNSGSRETVHDGERPNGVKSYDREEKEKRQEEEEIEDRRGARTRNRGCAASTDGL